MRVYHPNIEGEELSELRLHGRPCTDWGVCVGVQREWKPNYTLCQLIISIEMLFEHPNYDDNLPGLASTAAEVLKTDPAKFEAIAKEWMKGDTHRVK
ncbi:hypothetical protein AGDE_04088 [Angomonas deanei]|nr:hypothetical protein AGDE_04088 [Angomonas deanei]|eukprot:EPY39840.1 hypothetical protein AGDE_04088 [Angomonas deanei]